jgi:DNA-binding Lrp family transcriptional regulator
MNQEFPLCFETHLKIVRSEKPNRHNFNCEMLLKFLAKVEMFDKFTFSLRQIYIPTSFPKLRSFVLINPVTHLTGDETYTRVHSILTKGSLSEFCGFTYREEGFPSIDWVRSISKIVKHGEFVEQPNFIGYLPYPLAMDLVADGFSLIEFLESAKYGNLVLEFSLEIYNSPNEQALWCRAIKDLVNRLKDCDSKSNAINHALELYRKYQDKYLGNHENQLFNYSIKALGKSSEETEPILQTLIEKTSNVKRTNTIITFKPNGSDFENSLKATQRVQIFKGIKWNGWERETGKRLEQKLIKETIMTGGYLSSLGGDPSLNFPVLSKKSCSVNSNLSDELAANPDIGDLVLGGRSTNPGMSDLVLGRQNSSMLKMLEAPLPEVKHLKPLHHITTYQEVTGLFQIFSPSQSTNFPTLLAEEILRKYQHLITEDTYIVGVDDNWNPIISSWAEIPHRLIAGVTGTGKTNFIKSVIYQFLYANSERKIWIADFQAGMHYQLIADLQPNLNMVTELEEFSKLLGELWKEHEVRRELMRSNRVTSLAKLKEKCGIQKHRIVLIIDEAFFILNAQRTTKTEIDKHLTGLVAQSRVTGIHIVYCSQRPTPEVIPRQISDNMDDRIIFRVQSGASLMLLDHDGAASLPMQPKGRAFYKGLEEKSKVIATPYVPDEIWDDVL